MGAVGCRGFGFWREFGEDSKEITSFYLWIGDWP